MKVQVKKWGNSASVRIPTSVMAAASLSLDQAVDVREEGGRIIIEPIGAPLYDLDRLLDVMTRETFHDDEDFRLPVGHEAWWRRATFLKLAISSGFNSIRRPITSRRAIGRPWCCRRRVTTLPAA